MSPVNEPVTRMWGAVMTADGPVADVRDLTDPDEIRALWVSDEFRVWCVAAIEHGVPREGHSRGPCVPGAPCKKCQQQALSWWWEHGRRTKDRTYRAVHADAFTRNGWALRDWSETKHTTREDAEADARALGFGFVVLMDGHGKQLERFEVSP